MKRTIPTLALFALLTAAAAAFGQARPARRPATPATPAVTADAGVTPPPVAATGDAGAPSGAQGAICCCRVWSHGWQYSWRPSGDCTGQNGSCVSPDHC